ncbi:uncharacterized protein LOC143194829 [Rhynchophorus ferrugineus]|uniref:uncharacterized protein LOC143194829 n=1 Tax=Rhynchophorus ferrugineus TaxID=354439 RepID=UPI003FCE143A
MHKKIICDRVTIKVKLYNMQFFRSLVLLVVVASSIGKVIKIKNGYSTDLLISIDESQYIVASNSLIILNPLNEWSGSIKALPVNAEVTTGPKTAVNIAITSTNDEYSISLLDGFNLAAKIVPIGSTNCTASVCAANILQACPIEDQVVNSTNVVVGCNNSPLVMATLCPLAIVDADSAIQNSQVCSNSTGYMILFM